MTVVMKCDCFRVLIIAVNSGCGNNWPSKITSNVFYDCFRVTLVWFCINVKAFFMIRVALGFYFFERRSESASHFIKQCCAESITQISIIEVVDRTPESIITVTTFRYKTWASYLISGLAKPQDGHL